MTWTAPDVARIHAPRLGGEREMLQGWLDHHRQTLLSKCSGLTADQLKQRSCAPSTLSLLGLVRHMAAVERAWFRQRFAGEDVASLFFSEADPDLEFNDLDEADPAADFALFQAEVVAADTAAAERGLDDTFSFHSTYRGETIEMNLRWIYTHMVEEYARHNGHADLLRERIDGATGM